MQAIVSLLRGINVGGKHKVAMEDLRALYESRGLRSVVTYIQSGNVVFRSPHKDLTKLSLALERAFEERYGFRSENVLRTLPELKQLTEVNRFAARGVEPNKNVAIFLTGVLEKNQIADICSCCVLPEEMHADPRHLHCYFPDGMGRSKLPILLGKKLSKLGITGTARNWNTVLKLIEIAESFPA
ncbi:MAG TPA: DUF1697 domain-containing protein [Bryobacteraceae bacterium]|nr:DUF1697 domain-containing protein [Bryobacteraceae bacterium]